jgi:hypothetical protein
MTGEHVGIESFILGSELVTKKFGYWPSFHDAEVIDLHLWRGNVDPERSKYQFPVLILDLHHWELTSEVNDKGFLVVKHVTKSKLEFRDVSGFSMNGFNQQNAIFGLSIQRLQDEAGGAKHFKVEIEPDFGMAASFTCCAIEVKESVPSDEEGNPIAEMSGS